MESDHGYGRRGTGEVIDIATPIQPPRCHAHSPRRPGRCRRWPRNSRRRHTRPGWDWLNVAAGSVAPTTISNESEIPARPRCPLPRPGAGRDPMARSTRRNRKPPFAETDATKVRRVAKNSRSSTEHRHPSPARHRMSLAAGKLVPFVGPSLNGMTVDIVRIAHMAPDHCRCPSGLGPPKGPVFQQQATFDERAGDGMPDVQ